MEGSPNTPLPITEFTTKAVRLQRPMARISCWGGWLGGVSGTAWFYHNELCSGRSCAWAPGFARAWTAEGGRRRICRTGYINGLVLVTFDTGRVHSRSQWRIPCRKDPSRLWPKFASACAWNGAPIAAFGLVTFSRSKVTLRITKGACPWDIYSLRVADEMFDRQTEWPYPTWTTFISESRA